MSGSPCTQLFSSCSYEPFQHVAHASLLWLRNKRSAQSFLPPLRHGPSFLDSAPPPLTRTPVPTSGLARPRDNLLSCDPRCDPTRRVSFPW